MAGTTSSLGQVGLVQKDERTAAQKVLDIRILLIDIINCLTPQDILVVASRVCHSWREAVDSKLIRQALLFGQRTKTAMYLESQTTMHVVRHKSVIP